MLWVLVTASAAPPTGVAVCGEDVACVERVVEAAWGAVPDAAFVEICDQALAAFPEAPAAVGWWTRSGELLYQRGEFAAARTRLERAVLLPSGPGTERAAMLLLDTLNQLEDLVGMEETAASLLARGGWRSDTARTLRVVQEAAATKRASIIEDPAAAAAAWLSVVERFPGGRDTPTALQNAAFQLERLGQFERAVEVRTRLLGSESALDPRLLAANRQSLAFDLVHLGREPEAAAQFEALHDRLRALGSGDTPEARDALINAAYLYPQLGERDHARDLYRAYLRRYPDGLDAGRARDRGEALAR
jgi:tetratricopeptide (TPR) repeat protein